MFIKLTADRRVVLEDRDNFRAFKLVVEGQRQDFALVRTALRRHCRSRRRRHRLGIGNGAPGPPEVADDVSWRTSFAAMIEKARPHGWIDDARKAIKAHVEWVG